MTRPDGGMAMVSKNRSRRAQFPGTEAATETSELPAEPLPPEPSEDDSPRRGITAPIMMAPVGGFDPETLGPVKTALEEVYKRAVAVHKALPVPKYAFNPTRQQYHSAAILKRVEALYRSEWDSVVGFTDVDLFVPEVPFIFGEADRSTRSAIIGVSRLGPEGGAAEVRREALMKRLVSESIHQLGLIRGLAHCPNNRCVMFYAATTLEIDKRGSTMCANCRKRLLDLY